MVQAKQHCGARERAVLNEIKWIAAMWRCQKSRIYLSSRVSVCVVICIFDGKVVCVQRQFRKEGCICVCAFVCVCVCVLKRASAVRHVWSCLLGGVARTEALVLSSPHDSPNVNTKQAGHQIKKNKTNKHVTACPLSSSENLKIHHEVAIIQKHLILRC